MSDGRRLRVAVLMGGMSAEREVSLKTGTKVVQALDPARYEVITVDPRPRDEGCEWLETMAREQVDVAFIALHGRFGEDGTIQGLLELLGIPYTGSGVLSSALAIHKVRSKQIYRSAGIPTPESVELDRSMDAVAMREWMDNFPIPAVVKPSREGSTIGVTIVRSRDQMAPAVEMAFQHDASVLIERFVAGIEITASVLGNDHPQALPLIEIVPRSGFYDYEMKYTPGATEEIVPARISPEQTEQAQNLAIQAHLALGCRGVSRTDMIVAPDEIWVLETNTIPGMTETSLLPRAAAGAGISFTRLVERIIAHALE